MVIFRSSLRISGVLLLLASAVASTGSHHFESKDLPVSANRALLELRQQGLQAIRSGSFERAADLYGQGARLAKASGDIGAATHFLSNLGATYLGMFDYQNSMHALLEGRKLAEERQDKVFLGIIASSLAAVYWQVGDVESADQAAERGLKAAGNADLRQYRALLMITLGRIRSDQGRLIEAVRLLQEAIEAATDQNVLAAAWDCLGEVLLESGHIAESERPLEQGFRLRLLSHDRDLRVSYLKLSRLRLAQHDTHSASVLFDRAFSLPVTDAGLPVGSIYGLKGKILLDEHRDREALAWFEKSLKAWEIWRDNVASADEIRARSGSFSKDIRATPMSITALMVDTSLAIKPSPNVEAFVAVEEYRASAMRQTLAQSPAWRQRLPSQYWRTLEQLRSAQTAQLYRDTTHSQAQIERYQQDLIEFEVDAGISPSRPIRNKSFEKVDASVTLRGIQRGLKPEEALFSFYLGEPVSAMWAITDKGIELHRLPSGKLLASCAKEFAVAVERGSGNRDRLGEELYRQLFQDLSPVAERKPVWLIGAADELFDVPVAALVIAKEEGKPVYLVERHATQRVPSALMLRDGPAQVLNGTFLGLADGIYNVADPRWRREIPRASLFGVPLPSRKPKTAFELPRLAGSAREIEMCARIWQGSGPPVLLTGGASSRARFEASLGEHPSIIHLAAHVIPRPEKPNQALIDLGLSPDGQPEVLTYDAIANLKVPGSTVVVNGCASANARAKFGEGVMGLTRAWLMAGAQTVVGTRWPIPDDTGDLFQSFYSNWQASRGSAAPKRIVAQSLQRAQLSVLHSNTWRSDPKYWSAFYVFGKD